MVVQYNNSHKHRNLDQANPLYLRQQQSHHQQQQQQSSSSPAPIIKKKMTEKPYNKSENYLLLRIIHYSIQ
ncbi:hypothetical protein DERF_003967 [Dermatophagoides farinae]|uniref:Uncharacterized protein n=1 Tax=Dermatophagoides farinae TaxID=6954 RepID=A0A922LBY9_DERFA|nr:hypothetical protein DERF_003967 [Dermatophagoides farinae]